MLVLLVFGRGVFILFLHGLSDVKMVGDLLIFPIFSQIYLNIRRLLFYTPPATVVRLLTTNFLIAYITSWVLYLSGASEDPRMLLPAWVSIAMVSLGHIIPKRSELWLIFLQTLTLLYHLTYRSINIRKETSASISVFSIASFISLCTLLLQLHLTRENDPVVPLFSMLRTTKNYLLALKSRL